MTQHKPVLSDAERKILISGNLLPVGLSLDRLERFTRNVEQAVLAKLAEQEPVATVLVSSETGIDITYHQFQGLYDGMELYAKPMPCVSHTSNKTTCVSKNGKSETQENVPFTPKTAPEMRSFIGMNFDSLQYANPETEEPDEMDRYTLTIHDLLSAFSWAGHYDCDHIADARKMVTPDGWQLVPIEPTEEMRANLLGWHMGLNLHDAAGDKYKAMLAAAPKYKWGKE